MGEKIINTLRFGMDYVFTDRHFRNTLAVMLIGVACYKEARSLPISESFSFLLGAVISMYFQKKNEQASPPRGG